MKAVCIAGLVLIGVTASVAQSHAHYYGAVDVGSRGVSANLYSFVTEKEGTTSNIVFSKLINTSLVSSMENGSLSPRGIMAASEAVQELIDEMQKVATTRDLDVDSYYIVGSGGVARANNRTDLEEEIKAKTGIQMDFADLAEEGYYAMLSSVPQNRRLHSVYVDVGSGNTKLSCLLGNSDLASFRSTEIAQGSISGRNEAVKRSPSDIDAGVESVMDEVRSNYQAHAKDVSCLRAPERIYWTGGAAWATATFMHPGDVFAGWVVITRHDVDTFISRLKDGTWNKHRPNFNFPEGTTPQQERIIREKAQKELEDVPNVFTREEILAGVSIMKAIWDSTDSAASLEFVRNANFIYGYAAEKFGEHASLKIYPTRYNDAPKYAIYRLVPLQVQVLKGDAARLTARVDSLKGKSGPPEDSVTLLRNLRNNVATSLEELDKTESEIHKRKPSDGSVDAGAAENETAKVFFDDLRMNYLKLLKRLETAQAVSMAMLNVKSTKVSFATSDNLNPAKSDYSTLTSLSLHAIEENALAFASAANSASLTFDLKVYSTPEGATIQYKRRGDKFRANPEVTDAVISSLPLAIWIVHVHVAGYEDQEIEHDPFRETEHRIDAVLRKAHN